MSSNAPCNQTWKSGNVVFLGTVTAKFPAETPARAGTSDYLRPQFAFHFSVTESFRGPAIPGKEIVVYTGGGGGDCGYPFTVGTSYLVYAFASKDELTTGICTPTSPEVMVGAVVRQLRALQSGRRVDDLFGTIGTAAKGVGYDDLAETAPLADIRVRVIGIRSPERSTTTDREGVYSFQSLPSDTYRLEVDLPAGMSTWQRNRGDTITVQIGNEGSSGCRTDLFARPDGRISGWVVDDTGSGLAGFVTIKPADPKEAEAASRRGGLPGYTTEDGSFTLSLLPPGRYRLLFHPKIDGNVNLGVPAALSDIVDLSFGQHLEDFRFKLATIRTTPQ
ncbi:MAG: hypothetical protein ABJB21_10810 [bacterium]